MIFIGFITLLPLIALFYDGYLKNGIKGGLINLFLFGVVSFIASLLLKQFLLSFVFAIPFLFVFLILHKSTQKNK